MKITPLSHLKIQRNDIESSLISIPQVYPLVYLSISLFKAFTQEMV